MTGRFIDFDAARAERSSEPLELRAYGMTFVLPGSMSAALFLDVLHMQSEKGDEAQVTPADAIDLLGRVLPEDVLEELLERDDFSAEDFVELAALVMRAYMSKVTRPGEEPPPGKAGASRPGARRSTPAKSARSRGSRARSNGRPPKAAPGTTSSSTGS